MKEIVKKMEETTKVREGFALKSKGEITEINGALNNIVIVHKEIPSELFEKVYDVKREASKFFRELEAFKEETRNLTKSPDVNAWTAAFMEKWQAELSKQVEFPVRTLTKQEMTQLINANKEQGLTAGHVDFLYNLFNVN